LPAGLDYVLSRALAKNPEQRYQRGMEMSLDLQNVLAGYEPWSKTMQQSTKPPTRAPWDRVPLRHRLVTGSEDEANQEPPRDLRGIYRWLTRAARSKWDEFPLLRPVPVLLVLVALYGTSRHVASARPEPPLAATPSSAPKQANVAPLLPSPTSVAVALPPPTVRAASGAGLPTRFATVDIQVEKQFPQANVTIWVDDQAIFQRKVQGAPKKKMGIFRSTLCNQFRFTLFR